MATLNWRVVLHTPLGARSGLMHAEIQGNQLQGVLQLLRREQPFTGTLEQDGSCRLSGFLKSLKQVQCFQAEGTLQPETVRLKLHLPRRDLLLTGSPLDDADKSGRETTGKGDA